MTERLTYPEIVARYAPEWVLIGDPETDEHLEILSGEVLIHSPDRDELGRRMLALQPRPARCAVEFLGKMPDDLALVL
ncbi:MAG: hypothetical protein JWN86_652 [Planctomycetota bacterium]|nr:hypothetical protein [Planctomycetota bacterium]